MNSFTLKIWDDEGKKVTFYSVWKEDAALAETDKFLNKYEHDDIYAEELDQLVQLVLVTIGDEYGALSSFFNRVKNDIVGLPHKGKLKIEDLSFHFPDFPFRLYALRVLNREDLVILFNGGLKTARTDQLSPDLEMKFHEAQHFASRIEQALREGDIIIDEEKRRLTDQDGNLEIYL
ncbi:MAG: hypothetical protein HYZ15_04890 [Sphingobacteriales bacterium]|nr:hypothetical protein [Sphingobacteriales bacterium]